MLIPEIGWNKPWWQWTQLVFPTLQVWWMTASFITAPDMGIPWLHLP